MPDPTSRPIVDGSHDELASERRALGLIQDVHHAQLERARRTAEGLAEEAAEATEEGIRDLVDEDAEVDAAVRAALVRQTSDRAMHAARRVAELEARGSALAFGHVTSSNGERLAVGRLSVIDGEEPLLVDWRARASVPFYRATPLEPMGVRQRRHFLYCDETTGNPDDLVDYTDEIFDLDALGAVVGLRGEAAILASVEAPTPQQMRSVVATIQSEQDAVIRASTDGPLVVQGGPGTGKTVVALHRAAYLLYDQREELADTGVLIVGPSNEFLRYIAGVLPSLGESGVISVTADKLYAGILTGRPEADEVAACKGRAEMVSFLAAAVADRQRRPTTGFTVYYGSRRVDLSVQRVQEFFDRARRHVMHNEAAAEFRSLVIDALLAEVYDPSFRSVDDARDTFRTSRTVTTFLLRHLPPMTPERALNDLFGSKALLQSAARNSGGAISAVDAARLWRERAAEDELDQTRWSVADVPLLDELLSLLGGSMGQTEEQLIRARDELDEFMRAARADRHGGLDLDDGFDGANLAQTERPDDDEDVDDGMLSFDDPYFDHSDEGRIIG